MKLIRTPRRGMSPEATGHREAAGMSFVSF